MTLRRPTLGAICEVRCRGSSRRRRLGKARRRRKRRRVTRCFPLHELLIFFTRHLEGRLRARRYILRSTPSSRPRDVVTHPGVEVPIGYLLCFMVLVSPSSCIRFV